MKINYRLSLAVAISLICLTASSNSAGSEMNEVTDPINEYATKVSRQFNPQNSNDSVVLESIRLIRFIADFNSDGLKDIAISNGPWGNAGGEWEIYMGRKDGKYTPFKQTIFFHPLAINIEPKEKGSSQITIYSRHNVDEGSLIEYLMTSQDLKPISSKPIRPNENVADEKEYQKLFGHLYKEPISEFCMLSDYLKQHKCNWRKGYY